MKLFLCFPDKNYSLFKNEDSKFSTYASKNKSWYFENI